MIEFFTANLAEIIMVALTTVLGGVWAVLSGFASRFKSDMVERKQMWELELQNLNGKLDGLDEDHKDIKRDVTHLKVELSEKVEKIMTDHASHERDQAVQLEILRDLKESAREKK